MFCSRAFCSFALMLAAGNAMAAPPSSCASKFVGTWQHSTTNVATRWQRSLQRQRFCLQGTWTCNGNSLTYTNSSGTFVYTLQSSGVMTYGSFIVTRIGGGGIQTGYQPSGSQPLRAGKKIAADPPPEGLDMAQRSAWDVNEFASDQARKWRNWNPAKKPVLNYTQQNRRQLEDDAQKQKGSNTDNQ
jgi:hypothetical protein